MQKILAAFKSNPTPAAAKKLVDHVRKHPMVLCMMTADDMAAHTQAQRMVEA
jgi:DNA-binding MurR/RpiR family transcriptional regulator